MSDKAVIKKVDFSWVENYIEEQAPREAIFAFDCDGTLITHDIASHMCWDLLRSKKVQEAHLPPEWEDYKHEHFSYNHFLELRKKMGQRLELEEIFRWEVATLTGFLEEEVIDLSRELLKKEFSKGLLKPIPMTFELAKKYSKNAYIVSGSPYHCVVPIGEAVGIPRERVFATRMKVSGGKLQSVVAPPGLIWAEVKKEIMDEKGLRPWFSAGDSMGDLALLNMSTGMAWCNLKDSEVNSFYSLRKNIEHFLLHDTSLPSDSGLYVLEVSKKLWVLSL